VLALEYLNGGGASQALNLGSGEGTSVRSVIETVERVSGSRVRYEVGPARPGDPAVLVADARRAASVLGWRRQHAKLDGIIQTAWKWYARMLESELRS